MKKFKHVFLKIYFSEDGILFAWQVTYYADLSSYQVEPAMELMYVILALLIIISSSLGIHVTPNKTVRCSNDEVSCLTLQKYAIQSHLYFINDTTVHFGPDIHTLNRSLRLKNLHNFTFHGLPDDEFQSVNILLGSLVSITWEECSNIEISSIAFTILSHFTFSIIFEQTHAASAIIKYFSLWKWIPW